MAQQQAESFMQVLRTNPKVAKNTRVLSMFGYSSDEAPERRHGSTWMSWIPLLLAPLMTNLQELSLYHDIFSNSHPSFPMAITAFKSIRSLELYGIPFATFTRYVRRIQAFPHINHISSRYISWKPRLPSLLPYYYPN